MKTPALLGLLAAFATALHASPADDVAAAAKKLTDAANYSWTSTTEIANSQFPASPVEGVTEKDGFTVTTRSFNGNASQTVRKGEQVVMQNRDGDWMTMEDMRAQFAGGQRGGQGGQGGGQRGGGRGGFAGAFGGGFFGGGQRNPAETVANLVSKLKNLKSEGDVITGTATGDDATALLAPAGGRGGQGRGAGPKYSSVEVKFWIKDGALVKYTLHSLGTFSTADGEQRDLDSTTTTELKNIGSTKVDVPEAAKKKFGA